MLRNWLIHFFGGCTQEYCDLVAKEAIRIAREDASKQIEDVVRRCGDDINYFKEESRSKDKEIQRLTNLILTEHGVIHPEVQVRESSSPMLPISGRRRWKQTQAELAKRDADEHGRKLKEQWEKKNASNVS